MSNRDEKDLDFDELDKAVSSLMGGVKDKDPDSKENNLDINSTLGPDESPSYKHLGQVAGTIGSEAIDRPEQTVSLGEDDTSASAPSPANSPALKRSGRFMDVVHPSSDMRTSLSATVSREGATIKAPESLPPLDTTEGNLPSSGDVPAEETAEPEDTSEEPQEEAAKTPEPLSSPFLPDTKVEKRPLGGLATEKALEPKEEVTVPEEEPSASEAETTEPAPDTDTKADQDDAAKKDEDEFSKMDAMAAEPAKNLNEVNEHIPEEYKNELLAVEQNIAAPLDSSDTKPANEPAAEPPVPVIASIPQQYQEKPSTGEQTSGAIYDTDNYHKPVSHPAEQKSGWMWVVVIIALIVIGGLLGAAAYFFGLI